MLFNTSTTKNNNRRKMKQISLYRQVNIEDINELTPRKGSVSVTVQINTSPQLKEIDNKISNFIDVLSILEQNLDSLEQDYFEDLDNDTTNNIEPPSPDLTWKNLNDEYQEEIDDRDKEYESLLEKFNLKIN